MHKNPAFVGFFDAYTLASKYFPQICPAMSSLLVITTYIIF
jgi:hypothetical protein